MTKKTKHPPKIAEWIIGFLIDETTGYTAYLLSKDYLKLIFYSAIFAIPGGYFLTEGMFQFFAFRPDLNLWVLPATLVFILILALLTIGSQTIKAAFTNPVETLRTE